MTVVPRAWARRAEASGSVLLIYALVMVVGVLAAALSPTFREASNLANILRQSIVLGLVAVGQSLVVLAGGIDMSIAMIARVSALTVAAFFGGNVALMVPLVLLGLGMGAGLGLVNGVLITRIYANPFIITFGALSALRGVSLAIASGPVGEIPPAFLQIYEARVAGLPVSIVGMALVWAVTWLVMTRTSFGRALYAVGGSPRVAHLSAIDVPRTLVGAYMISGLVGAAAGLFLLARTGVGDPSLAEGLEFQSIVAVALGGIRLSGGRGSLLGTLGGVLLLGVAGNVFNILQVDVFFQQLLLGLVVLIAVAALKSSGPRST